MTSGAMLTRRQKTIRETSGEAEVPPMVSLMRIPDALLRQLNEDGSVRVGDVEKTESWTRKRRSQDIAESPISERTRSRLHLPSSASSSPSSPSSLVSTSSSVSSPICSDSSGFSSGAEAVAVTPRRTRRRQRLELSRDSLVQRVQKLTLEPPPSDGRGAHLLRSRTTTKVEEEEEEEEEEPMLLGSPNYDASSRSRVRTRSASSRNRSLLSPAPSESDDETITSATPRPSPETPSPAPTTRARSRRRHRSSRQSESSADDAEAPVVPNSSLRRWPLAPLASSPCAVTSSSPATPTAASSRTRQQLPPRTPPPPVSQHHHFDLSPLFDDSPLSQASIRHAGGKRKQRFRLLRSRRVELEELTLSFEFSAAAQEASLCVGLFDDPPGTDYRAELLQRCGQKEPMDWEDVLPPGAKENLVQIGEGDFAQAYCSQRGKSGVVLKVMAACDDADKNAAWWIKGFSHFLPEVVASQLTSDLRFKYPDNRCSGFVPMNRCCIVKGKFPEDLAELTHKFREERGMDEEELYEESCDEEQEWLVLEFPYCGSALDSLTLLDITARGMRSIVAQVSLSLAAAELAFEMEHRDLHFGNILVRKLRDPQAKLRFRVGGQHYAVVTEGYVSTIIDFTLSRVTENERVTYVDLTEDHIDDEAHLPAHLEVHYQTKAMNKNRWRDFNPKSNILWVQFLARQFCDELRDAPMAERRRHRNDTNHTAIISELECLSDEMEKNFDSCAALVATSFFFDAFRYDDIEGV